MLQAKPAYPAVPLIILCDADAPLARMHLQLEKYAVEGLVSKYDVVCVQEAVEEVSATQKVTLTDGSFFSFPSSCPCIVWFLFVKK